MIKALFQLSRYDPSEVALLRTNLAAHMLDGVFYGVAVCFISQATLVPVFVKQLGGGPVAVGSVAVLWTLCWNFPQIFFLPLTHRGGLVKPPMLRTSFILRICFLVLALASLAVGTVIAPRYAVAVILGIVVLIALSGSVAGPPWQQLYTLTVPVAFRGRLLALRQFVSAIVGIAAGWFSSVALEHLAFPESFALLFGVGFVLSMCSFYFLTWLNEPAHPVHDEPGVSFGEILHRAAALLRRDRRFRKFLVTDAAHLIALTLVGYLAVYGMERFRLPVSSAGTFTMISMAGMIVANTAGGYIADHYGHKVSFVLLLGSMSVTAALAWLAPSVETFAPVFFFSACGISLQGISRLQYVSEISSDTERPLYIAITNTITAPTLFVGIGAGMLIGARGYAIAFALYAVLSFAATAWTLANLEEPRAQTA